MVSKRCDYSYLLDELRSISNEYHLNVNGKVVNNNGEEKDDSRLIANIKFYIVYCMAYRFADSVYNENKENNSINRALTNYGMFNSFVNNCLGEYRIYGDIGTGNVKYVPYQALADFFFENNVRKDLLKDYLNCELENILSDKNSKIKVKGLR